MLALSSMETEFAAATEAGKSIIYVHIIRAELGIHQWTATILYIENNGAMNISNNPQNAHGTYINYFDIQGEAKHNLMFLKRTNTKDN